MSTRSFLPRALKLASACLVLAGFGACADSFPGDEPEERDAAPPPRPDSAPPLTDGAPEASLGPCVAEACPVEVQYDTRAGLYSIWGSGPRDVWAGGSRGTVLHFDGTAWKASTLATPNAIFSIWGSEANDVWFASSNRRLFRYSGATDGGTPFTPSGWDSLEQNRASGFSEGRVWSLWGDGRGRLVASGEAMQGFRYLDETGTSFLEYSVNLRVLGARPDAGAGADAGIGPDASRDGGARDGAVDGSADAGVASALPWNPIECLDKSSSGGQKAPCYQFDARAVWGASVAELVVSGSEGRLFHLDGVATNGNVDEAVWRRVETQTKVTLTGLWGTSATNYLAVGERGTLLRSDGTNITAVDLRTADDLHAIWGSGPRDIWVVGARSAIFHYDGAAWKPVTVDARYGPLDLFGVWGTAGGDVWIVGDGALLRIPRKG